MKKFIIQTVLAISILSMMSCDKIEDASRPYEDTEAHALLWNYSYNQHQKNSDVLPAMDENDNLFFSIQESPNTQSVYAFGIDKNGNELWNKTYTSNGSIDISRMMYKEGKVFYYVTSTSNIYEITNTIFCLNATDGAELWSYIADFNYTEIITSIALADNYLIIGAKWGEEIYDHQILHYLNLSGNYNRGINIENYNEISHISAAGTNLYLGANYTLNTGNYTQPTVISMNMESNEINYAFRPEYENEISYTFEQKNIAIDGQNRAFCIITPKSGFATHNLYIINEDGSLAHHISETAVNIETFDILIGENNSFYVALNGFKKYNSDASEEWIFTSSTSVPNDNFLSGCLLADNGIIYHGEEGGLLHVNDFGTPYWAQYDQTGFSHPGYPALNSDGDIIVVGDLNVSCFKGDDAAIMTAPWPRVYGNYGNTASR